jgi:hypothetical protein
MVSYFALQSLQFAQHLKAASAQSQTRSGVLDYGSGRNCIEFGVGKGLTRATESCVGMLMQEGKSTPVSTGLWWKALDAIGEEAR